ncbi:diguanylate cyclase domain-containing protein [Magnetovibrio sp.]|uniref:diguanylate cyclase domain-containing protein n=1 Tax=Magnetovibrio sp. TaxID=2024836 RepID=UPI002F95961F
MNNAPDLKPVRDDRGTARNISRPTNILQEMSPFAMSGVLDALSDMVCVCIDGTIRHVNTSGLAILGANNTEDLIGRSFQSLICDDFATTIDNIIAVMADEPDAMPMRIKGVNGKLVSLRLKVVSVPDLGETAHIVMGENVTRQAELTDAIHESQARFRKLVDNALDLICVMNDGLITYINTAGMKMLKAAYKDEVIGQPLETFLHDDYKGIFSGDIRELVAEDMLIPVRFVDISQNQIDAEVGISILDSGRGSNFMIEARDITAHNRAVTALRQSIETLEQRVEARTRALQDEVTVRRQAEEKLRHVATHDGLTDLPNRSLMLDRLDKAIARAKRNQTKCAVMFLDLDGFKPINDTLGHDQGDLVLREAAMRLNACIRDADTAARFGGDEFVLVLSDLTKTEDGAMVAAKVLQALSEPIELNGHSVQVGTSIGIALYPDHGHNAETVLKHADNAMYAVKGGGKNNYAFAPAPNEI